ncbi:MAG: hypothetical protein WAV73_02410 [Candidatus Moraniibacteriota bacterium]
MSKEFPQPKAETKENLPKEKDSEIAFKEWQEFYNKYSQLQDDVHDLIWSLERDRKRHYFDKRQEQLKRSFASVADPRIYLTYHRSIGGSAHIIDTPKLDFEGEYSLFNFLEKLQEEIKNEIENGIKK